MVTWVKRWEGWTIFSGYSLLPDDFGRTGNIPPTSPGNFLEKTLECKKHTTIWSDRDP